MQYYKRKYGSSPNTWYVKYYIQQNDMELQN